MVINDAPSDQCFTPCKVCQGVCAPDLPITQRLTVTRQDMPRLNYDETAARAAECLRLALPQMTRQPVRPHPLSYAVWYEHVSGRNAALSAELERLMANGASLDEASTTRLYRHHVQDGDEQVAQRVADGFRNMIDDVGQSAQQAGRHSERFETALLHWQEAVDTGAAADPVRRAAIEADTRAMRSAVAALHARMLATRSEVDRLKQELDRAREEALRDSLTGLANRRAFDLQLAACLVSHDPPACLLLGDIDHFKRVNDTYGHLFGDQVLKAVAQGVSACLGPAQVAARVGGEEFAILLPGASLPQAQALAERVRATVAGSRIRRRGEGEAVGQVTISLGVAAQRRGETGERWFERADQALYAAKNAGRNRVSLSA